MGYCGSRGIPLSTFLAWPAEDQEAALAWQGYESRRCRSCGYHPDDGGAHAHIDVCPGCVAREHREEDAKKIHGAHLTLAHGPLAECDRCREEHGLNISAPK